MLPILLSYLIILVMIVFVFLLAKRFNSRHKSYLNISRTYWMLGSYLVILLVATVVYFVLPKEDRVYSEHTSQDNIPNLVDYVYEGIPLDDAYIQQKWELPYDQNELNIVGQYEDYVDFDILISVERKAEDDGIVEITHYKTPIFVEGLDVTEFMDPINVELSPSTLEVTGLERVDVELHTYRNDFPVRQFTEENWWVDWEHAFGRQVLSLRIPYNLQIIDQDEHFNIHYVQE